jgi:hypothetical protein
MAKEYSSVRLAKALVDQARVVAAMRGESIGEFIENEFGPIVRQLDAELTAKRASGLPTKAARPRQRGLIGDGGAGEGRGK